MSDYEEPSYKEKIKELMGSVTNIVSTTLEEDYFTTEDYEKIQTKMGDLLKQGVFFLNRKEPKRFIYDLNHFLKWVTDFVEQKEWQNKDEF
jgi:hypothetical protein